MFKESNDSHRHENNDTEKATQVLVAILVSRRLKNYQVQAKHSKTQNFR